MQGATCNLVRESSVARSARDGTCDHFFHIHALPTHPQPKHLHRRTRCRVARRTAAESRVNSWVVATSKTHYQNDLKTEEIAFVFVFTCWLMQIHVIFNNIIYIDHDTIQIMVFGPRSFACYCGGNKLAGAYGCVTYYGWVQRKGALHSNIAY